MMHDAWRQTYASPNGYTHAAARTQHKADFHFFTEFFPAAAAGGFCRECFSMAIFALISSCLSIIFENGDEIYAALRKCSTSGGRGGVYLQHVVYVVM